MASLQQGRGATERLRRSRPGRVVPVHDPGPGPPRLLSTLHPAPRRGRDMDGRRGRVLAGHRPGCRRHRACRARQLARSRADRGHVAGLGARGLQQRRFAQPPGDGIVLSGGTTGSWTSSWQTTRFSFSQLIPSWTADTPAGSWIEVEIQARTAAGRETRWWRMGIWAYGDETIRRTSVSGQSDADGVVETDTFKTRAEKMTAYRARVTLSRMTAAGATPALRRIYAVVSDTRSYTPRYPSPRYADRAMELSVPRYSKEIHAGEFPQYDGGGEAWCSPTST